VNLGGLSKQVGPLPLGVWLLVGGGGLFIAYRKSNTPAAVVDPLAGPVVPAGGVDPQVSSWDGAPVVLSPVVQIAPPRIEINNTLPAPAPITINVPAPIAAPPAPPRVASPVAAPPAPKPVAKPAPVTYKGTAGGPANYPGHLIQYGSTGTYVQSVQRAVHVTADGKFGPITRAAVIAYQASHGLVPDGQVGPLTWAKMYGGTR
jgi:hypothetical protein